MAETDELAMIEARLRGLGRDLGARWPEEQSRVDMSDAVLEQLAPSPGRDPGAWWRSRRAAVAVVIAVALGLGAVSPVGAAVARWLGFGGVAVEQPTHDPSSLPTAVPPASPGLDFGEAAALVDFAPADAAALGRLAGVEVSDDRRVLSMTWAGAGGPLRLDQFDGELSWVWLKQAMPDDVRITNVGSHDAVWFGSPHPLTYVDAQGRERVAESRMAAPALVWVVDGVTRRLEGELGHDRAVALAESIG